MYNITKYLRIATTPPPTNPPRTLFVSSRIAGFGVLNAFGRNAEAAQRGRPAFYFRVLCCFGANRVLWGGDSGQPSQKYKRPPSCQSQTPQRAREPQPPLLLLHLLPEVAARAQEPQTDGPTGGDMQISWALIGDSRALLRFGSAPLGSVL